MTSDGDSSPDGHLAAIQETFEDLDLRLDLMEFDSKRQCQTNRQEERSQPNESKELKRPTVKFEDLDLRLDLMKFEGLRDHQMKQQEERLEPDLNKEQEAESYAFLVPFCEHHRIRLPRHTAMGHVHHHFFTSLLYLAAR